MKFQDYSLHDKVKKALDLMDFRRPTDIQYKAIPSIMKGEDVLAVAQTGTGKTAAYAIPTVDRIYKAKLSERRSTGARCLVLAPTHELAEQISGVYEQITKYTTLKVASIIGGVDQDPQIAKLTSGVDIIIATPGRMFDLISQGFLKVHHVEVLILDEADHMLELGFLRDIQDLVRKLPKRRQTLFFSATINDKIKKVAYGIVRQGAIRIQLSPKDPVAKKIDHYVLYVEMDDKRFFLERVIAENPESKILVFVRTKVRAERVAKAMARVDINTVTMHGDKTQEERSATLLAYRNGEVMVMIATDITARGIDIPDVTIVINYDLPTEPENYVHRVGRTGRASKRGYAYSFCARQELPILEAITSYLKKEIKEVKLTKGAYKETLSIEKDRTKDIEALITDIEEYEKKKKKKKRRWRK